MIDTSKFTVYRDPKCSCEPGQDRCSACQTDLLILKGTKVKCVLAPGVVYAPHIPDSFKPKHKHS